MATSQFTEIPPFFCSFPGIVSPHGHAKSVPSVTKKIREMAYRGLSASLIGLAILSCSGCGGGGGSSTPAVQAATQASPKHIVILMRGDSTNFGFNPQDYPVVPNQTPNNPTVLMQRDMDATFGAGRVIVVNGARSGTTLSNDISGLGDWPSLPTMLAQYKPDIVLTNSELNDRNTLGDGQYKSDLIQWIQIVQAAGARPVLQEPNPVCPTLMPGRNDSAFVQDMNDVAAQMNVTILPNYTTWFPQPVWWAAYLQNDCIHPTDAGYASKEAQYFKNLAPIVTAMLK